MKNTSFKYNVFQFARNAWNIYPTKLPDVCRKLRISLHHHDAASDAFSCAQIVIRAIRDRRAYAMEYCILKRRACLESGEME